MALINCAGCGNKMSDRAAACPACGHPGNLTLQHPPVVTIEKDSHPILSFIGGAVVLCAVIATLAAVGNNRSPDPASAPVTPAPAARFVVTDVLMDENCTVLGNYCVNVHCSFQNVGDAAGAKRVLGELSKASGEPVGTRTANLTLLPGGTQRVTFSIDEALIDDGEYRAACRLDEAARALR